MNGVVVLIIGVALLACGYIFYGRWLCKQWGVGELKEETPAHTMQDGIDYVPAPAPVLMGHHCLLYTSPSPRDVEESRMPSSA